MTFADIYQKIKGMSNKEIEEIIKQMLSSGEMHELENTLPATIDCDTGAMSWKCATHGYCTAELWELFFNKGDMLDRFDASFCGYCPAMDEEFEFDDFIDDFEEGDF